MMIFLKLLQGEKRRQENHLKSKSFVEDKEKKQKIRTNPKDFY